MNINLTWINFKQLLDLGIEFIFFNTDNVYSLFSTDGTIIYSCQVPQIGDSDQNDFEQNYLPKAAKILVDGDPRDLISAQTELIKCLINEVKAMRLALITIGGLKDTDFNPDNIN